MNLVTGALGVGKTTTIAHLLRGRPAHERWAVLVNEFGRIGIDGDRLTDAAGETSGVAVREVAGGCLCCAVGVPTRVAVTEILRRVRPDRLLIEPSGLGHPAGLFDLLEGPDLGPHLRLDAVITLVDVRRFDDLGPVGLDPTGMDQIEIADVLVGNKADLADVEQVPRFRAWAKGLFPPRRVEVVQHGQLDPDWLALPSDGRRIARSSEHEDAHAQAHAQAHAHEHAHEHEHASEPRHDPAPRRPVRLEGAALGRHAVGWLFHPDDRFDERALIETLEGGAWPRRVKGVLRLASGRTIAIDRVDEELYLRDSAYRRSSRVEMVDVGTRDPLDVQRIEDRLLEALADSGR